MTRQQAITRWKEIVSSVICAEGELADKWEERLKAAPTMSREEQQKLCDQYLEAIATEIVSRTSDEELSKLE